MWIGNVATRPSTFRHARKAARLSQTLLASAIGGSRQMVSNVEIGARELRSGEIITVASLLRVSPHGLFRPTKPVSEGEVDALFRDDGHRPLALADHDLWELHDLLVVMNERPSAIRPLRLAPRTSLAEVCQLTREAMQVSASPPVDVLAGCRTLGIALFFTAFEGPSGARVLSAGGTRVGLVANSDHPDERTTWTIAHELGHWVLDHQPDEPFLREGPQERGRAEVEADAFAAEFLLPMKRVVAEIDPGAGEGLAAFAYRKSVEWQVSYRATVLRLASASFLRPDDTEALLNQRPSELEKRLQLKAHRTNAFHATRDCATAIAALRAEGTLPASWEQEFGDDADPVRGLRYLRRIQERSLAVYVERSDPADRADGVTVVYERVAKHLAETYPWA